MTTPVSRRRVLARCGVALALLATACASASAVRLGEQTFSPRDENATIVVYESVDELPRPFVKVGRVVGEGSDLAAFASIVEVMKLRARELGGDALVLTGGGLLLDGDGDCGIDVDRTVHGLAVRWQ